MEKTKHKKYRKGYMLLYYGTSNKRNGVGKVLHKVMWECVVVMDKISDRIILVKIVP